MYTNVYGCSRTRKKWADYLFKDGSIIGLNAELLKQYIEFIAGKRMRAVKLETPHLTQVQILIWTQAWITGGSVQVALKKLK